MKINIKITILLLSISLLVSIFVYMDTNTSSEVSKSNINSNTIIHPDGITKNIYQNPDIHTQTIDRNTEIKDLIRFNYPKSNLAWNTRTLTLSNGQNVTYVFGEGNPREVALSDSEIQNLPILARTEDVYYVTAEKEKALKNLLQSNDFYDVINMCYREMNFDSVQTGTQFLFPANLDMENIVLINSQTGRKYFNQNIIIPLLENFNILKSPVSEKWKNCLSENDSYKIDNIQSELSFINDKVREKPMEDNSFIERIPYSENNVN